MSWKYGPPRPAAQGGHVCVHETRPRICIVFYGGVFLEEVKPILESSTREEMLLEVPDKLDLGFRPHRCSTPLIPVGRQSNQEIRRANISPKGLILRQ